MIIKTLPVAPLMANCNIVGCEETREAVIIDPGGDAPRILSAVSRLNLTIKYIINTHGHFDHVGGNAEIKKATGAPLLIHKLDAPMLSRLADSAASFGLDVGNSPSPDQTPDDGDTIRFGTHSLKVIHTPGHSPGGISLHCEDVLFVGDSLFAGSIGRTDLPGGDFNTLINAIQTRLFLLDDETRVYTGHGPETTIGIERRTNPFVGQR